MNASYDPPRRGHWPTRVEPMDNANPIHRPHPQLNSWQPLPRPAPGWYPPGPPPHPYPHLLQPPRRNHAKLIAFVAFPLIAVGLLVLVIAGIHSARNATNDGVDASAPVAAVCQPGSYDHLSQRDAPTFQGATDIAECTARIPWTALEVPEGFDPSDRYGPIWVVQFSSLGAAQNEATRESLADATTLGTISGKTVLFDSPADCNGASLEPLTQFGFAITLPRFRLQECP